MAGVRVCAVLVACLSIAQAQFVDESKICPDVAGEDDLQGFDFISKFGLDTNSVAGVRMIRGSNRYQSAYRVTNNAELSIPTRNMFPYGLPSQFSFVSTFRMKSKTRREVWDLLRIEDIVGNPQFGIRLDGQNKEVRLYMLDYKDDLQTVIFESNKRSKKLFNSDWHKLMFSVRQGYVDMYVDCQLVATGTLDPRGVVDTSGNIILGRQVPTGAPARFDLQWLLMHCDPTFAEREQCDEIPLTTTPQTPENCKCPRGVNCVRKNGMRVTYPCNRVINQDGRAESSLPCCNQRYVDRSVCITKATWVHHSNPCPTGFVSVEGLFIYSIGDTRFVYEDIESIFTC